MARYVSPMDEEIAGRLARSRSFRELGPSEGMDLYDYVVMRHGRERAEGIWLKACEIYDRDHEAAGDG